MEAQQSIAQKNPRSAQCSVFSFVIFFVRSTQRVKPKSQQKPTKGDLMMTRNDLGGGFGVFHIVPDQNSSRAACMALIEGEADHFD